MIAILISLKWKPSVLCKHYQEGNTTSQSNCLTPTRNKLWLTTLTLELEERPITSINSCLSHSLRFLKTQTIYCIIWWRAWKNSWSRPLDSSLHQARWCGVPWVWVRPCWLRPNSSIKKLSISTKLLSNKLKL